MFAKKTLVAAAALLAAVAAQAQSSVSVYGNLDVGIGSFKAPSFELGTDGLPTGAVAKGDSTTKVESGIEAGSFIGFKGQEDLGGGLKAIFKLESVVGLDTGSTTSNFWTRTSEVGLAGTYGTLTAGNSLALNYLANATFNPFPVTGMLNVSQNLFQDENFRKNALTYVSPSYYGFSGAVQYSAAEAAKKVDALGASTTEDADDIYAVQLNYVAGPLAVGLTYTDNVALLPQLGVSASGSTGLKGQYGYQWQLGASYDFGVAKAFAQYGQAKADDNWDNKAKFYQLGVSVPVTANDVVLASFGENKLDDLRAREFSLAYDHSLSKRTGVYAGLVYANFKADNSESGTTYAVGLRHAF